VISLPAAPAGKGGLDIVGRDRLHLGLVLVEVVERQAVEADHGDVVEDLLVAVQAQREAAGQVGLGGGQFLLARAVLRKPSSTSRVTLIASLACERLVCRPIWKGPGWRIGAK
jgi:hypothetical protein